MSQPIDEKLSELGYVHERIDQLIRQTAAEVGLMKMQMGDYAFSHEEQTEIVTIAMNRFWSADDDAAQKFGRSPRDH